MSTINSNQVKLLKVMVSERAKECGITPSVAQEKFKQLVADYYEVETISTKEILVEDYEHLCSLINAEIKPIETKKSVFELISLVQGDLAREGISKSQTNKFDKYNFRGIDDVYNSLSPLMAKHGLVCIPFVVSSPTTKDKATKSGGSDYLTTIEVEYRLFSPSGEMVITKVFGEGSDRGDKSINKAMSSAYKNMAFQLFAIPTEGDNDPENHSPEFVPTPTVQLISLEQSGFLRNEIIGFARKEFPNTDPKLIGKMFVSYLGVGAISDLTASEFELIKRSLSAMLNEVTATLKAELLSVEQLNQLENMLTDFSAATDSPLSEMKSMILEKLNLKSFSDIKSNDFEKVKDLIESLFEEK